MTLVHAGLAFDLIFKGYAKDRTVAFKRLNHEKKWSSKVKKFSSTPHHPYKQVSLQYLAIILNDIYLI